MTCHMYVCNIRKRSQPVVSRMTCNRNTEREYLSSVINIATITLACFLLRLSFRLSFHQECCVFYVVFSLNCATFCSNYSFAIFLKSFLRHESVDSSNTHNSVYSCFKCGPNAKTESTQQFISIH